MAAGELEGKRIIKKWYARNLERRDKAMRHSRGNYSELINLKFWGCREEQLEEASK